VSRQGCASHKEGRQIVRKKREGTGGREVNSNRDCESKARGERREASGHLSVVISVYNAAVDTNIRKKE